MNASCIINVTGARATMIGMHHARDPLDLVELTQPQSSSSSVYELCERRQKFGFWKEWRDVNIGVSTR